MAKFNVKTAKPSAQSPIVTEQHASGKTYEGGPGYARDAKSELFLLAVSNMVGEKTFYESAGDRDSRYTQLVRQVAVADPQWTTGFFGWLRGEGNMRSASLVGAAEAVKARLDAAKGRTGISDQMAIGYQTRDFTNGGQNRQIVNAVLQRADEPGELLAYWTSRYGRAIPKPVKRGVADAVGRLYTEYGLLKYDTASKGFRFADVLDLCHPVPVAPWQGELFKHALERRHNREELVTSLPMLLANASVRGAAADGNFGPLLDADTVKAAGMTWEDVLSLAGSKLPKKDLWEALIPSMGYMALLRNLRNMDEAGVSDEAAAVIAAKLSDPEQVARSRQFPFRFLAAHRNAPSLRWGHALDKALTASLANLPELSGRTLVLIDRSGSMFDRMSAKSELTSADAAAVFGAAIALRNVGRVDLVEFGSGSNQIAVKAGDSLLRTVERFTNLGGTETLAAVRRWYNSQDRVLIVTDEQAWAGYGDPGSAISAHIPLYTWNLVGYQHGHNAGGANRHTFGGLTDAAFRMVSLLEAGKNAAWPWLGRTR